MTTNNISHNPCVLQIIAGLAIGEPLGGAERFGVELARHLDQTTFKPVVCAFWRRGGSAEQYWRQRLEDAGVEVFFASEYGKSFNFIRFIRGILRIYNYFRLRDVDIIHSHFQVGSIAGLFLRCLLKAKALIRTSHITLEWGNTKMGFLCRQVFTKWIFPFVFDVEVGVSEAVVALLNRRPGMKLTHKQAVLIPNGIALDRFEITAVSLVDQRERLGLPIDGPLIGTIGRLTEQKGYTYLIQAIPDILAYYPSAHFVFVGSGELQVSLQKQAVQCGVSNSIIFLGARKDVESFLPTLDLFVLPSLWEGLPTVVMEAMACYVPVVATDVPGTREIVEHGVTGWLVAPQDPVGLAQAIIYALGHPNENQQLKQKARDRVISSYSMIAIARRYESLYHNLLGIP